MRRVIDGLVAAAALLAAVIPLACAAVVIKLSSPGPVLYRQIRIGRSGRPFTLFKLRTMTVGSTGPQVTTATDARVTTVGRILRKLKIDEIPQFWNVLRGDMSLIGARPEVPRFVDRYSAAERRVLEERPGLASLAQLRYSHEAALLRDHPDPDDAYARYLMPAKIAADLQYQQTRTAWSDLRLIVDLVLMVVGLQRRVDTAFRLPTAPPVDPSR